MKRINVIYGILALLLLAGVPLTGFSGAKMTVAPASAATSVTLASAPTASGSSSQSIVLQNNCLLAEKFHGAIGVYAKNLNTGQVVTLNPDEIFAAASTIKVPVSIVVYRHFYDQADPTTRRVYDTGVGLMAQP